MSNTSGMITDESISFEIYIGLFFFSFVQQEEISISSHEDPMFSLLIFFVGLFFILATSNLADVESMVDRSIDGLTRFFDVQKSVIQYKKRMDTSFCHSPTLDWIFDVQDTHTSPLSLPRCNRTIALLLFWIIFRVTECMYSLPKARKSNDRWRKPSRSQKSTGSIERRSLWQDVRDDGLSSVSVWNVYVNRDEIDLTWSRRRCVGYSRIQEDCSWSTGDSIERIVSNNRNPRHFSTGTREKRKWLIRISQKAQNKLDWTPNWVASDCPDEDYEIHEDWRYYSNPSPIDASRQKRFDRRFTRIAARHSPCRYLCW